MKNNLHNKIAAALIFCLSVTACHSSSRTVVCDSSRTADSTVVETSAATQSSGSTLDASTHDSVFSKRETVGTLTIERDTLGRPRTYHWRHTSIFNGSAVTESVTTVCSEGESASTVTFRQNSTSRNSEGQTTKSRNRSPGVAVVCCLGAIILLLVFLRRVIRQ